MRPTFLLVCVATVASMAVPGLAHAAGGQSATPRAPLPFGLRAYVIVDLDSVAAKESFDAVLGTSQLNAFGGGVEVNEIWKHLFARVAFTRARKEGSRVFVNNAQVFPLGIPLTVTMTPIEAGAGWRFVTKSSRLTPYAGAAFLSMAYTETSKFAESGEDSSERFKGQDVFGGVDVWIVKWLSVAAEAQYRRVPNALGAGGASKDFNENDLGGFTARIMVGIRTKR